MCSCSGKCGCAPQSKVQPPLRSLPAPIPEITWSVLQLPAGSTPTVVVSGVPPVYHVQIGFPGAFSPTFGTNVTVNMIPNGDPASGTINNTDPLNPILTLNIPSPLDGQDGVSPFTELTASFVQPAAGSTVTITVADTSWMSLGSWIYIANGGGHYVVASNPLSATQILVTNPGAAQLSPFGWVATSIPTNGAPGATITSSGFDNQVQPSGPPGTIGETGASGLTPQVSIVYTVPVSAPVDAAHNLVLYFNAAPPSIPTIGRFYEWNGSSWDGGPNFVAAGGTITYSGNSNPNTSPPSGAKLLDLYIQFTGTDAVYWQLTSPSTWTTIGTVALLGTATSVDTHTGGGTYTFDAAVFSYIISTDSDIDLDADVTNYDGNGTWRFTIRNSDGSPHDFNIGGLVQSGIPTLPLSIPSLGAANVIITRHSANGTTFNSKFVVEQAYIPS